MPHPGRMATLPLRHRLGHTSARPQIWRHKAMVGHEQPLIHKSEHRIPHSPLSCLALPDLSHFRFGSLLDGTRWCSRMEEVAAA